MARIEVSRVRTTVRSLVSGCEVRSRLEDGLPRERVLASEVLCGSRACGVPAQLAHKGLILQDRLHEKRARRCWLDHGREVG